MTDQQPQPPFSAAERAWLDAVRAKHPPLSDRQAQLIRRVLKPRRPTERKGVAALPQSRPNRDTRTARPRSLRSWT